MAGNQAAVISGRDLIVYSVAYHSSTTTPANTVVWGTTWGTPVGQTGAYVDVGYTDGGVDISFEVTRGEIRVDQELDPVLRPLTGRNTTFKTALAEFTPANLYAAAGQGSLTTVAAGGGLRGYTDLDLSSTIADNYRTVGLDFLHPGDSEAFRVFVWRCLPSGAVDAKFNPEDKALIPFEMSAFPDSAGTPTNRILKYRDMTPVAA